MTHTGQMLRQVLVQIETGLAAGRRPLAVFDLDSTLFDVAPRLEKILEEFADATDHQRLFPTQIRHFPGLKIQRRDWGVWDALRRAGLDGEHPEFETALMAFWRERFFSHDYLKYDVPYPGAVEFVKGLHKRGCQIAYLTGRDIPRMGSGTEIVLRHWDFPIDDDAKVCLKPSKEMDDAEFKTNWFRGVNYDLNQPVLFFENEPVNINHLRRENLPVQIYFFDSTHCRREDAPDDLPKIIHFLFDEEH